MDDEGELPWYDREDPPSDAESVALEDEFARAARTAAEMLAAQGLGEMVNIDSIQRQKKASSQSTMSAQNTSSGAGGLGGIYAHSDVEMGEGSSTNSQNRGASSSQRPSRSRSRVHNLRSTSAKRVDYNEENTSGDIEENDDDDDSEEAEQHIPGHINDDDEDDDYMGGLDEDDEEDEYGSSDQEAMDDIEDMLREQSGIGKVRGSRSKGKSRMSRGPRGQELTAQAKAMLGDANILYVNKDLDNAFRTLCEVIRIAPHASAAWHIMALIREDQGLPDDALKLQTIAAHLTPSDNTMWDHLANVHLRNADANKEAALTLGDPEAKKLYNASMTNALYCLKKITRNDPKNTVAWEMRAKIQLETGNYRDAAKTYIAMVKEDPYNLQVIREGAPVLFHKRDDLETPIRWFSEALAFYNKQAEEFANPEASKPSKHRDSDAEEDEYDAEDSDDEYGEYDKEDGGGSNAWAKYYMDNPTATVPMNEINGYTYSDINMLAELRLLRREFDEAIVDIKRGSRFIQGRGREKQWDGKEVEDEMDAEYMDNQLPIELHVKLGLCRLLTGKEESARAHWEPLFDMDVVEYQDLFIDVGDAHAEAGNIDEAVDIYERLMEYQETNQPPVWERIAKCYREQGDLERAKKYAQAVIDMDPSDVDMRLWLGEVYEEIGQVDLAYSMIQTVEDIHAAERSQAGRQNRSVLAADGASQQAEGIGVAAADDVDDPMAGNLVNIQMRDTSEYTTRRKRLAEIERSRWLTAMRTTGVAFKKLDLLAAAINRTRGDGSHDISGSEGDEDRTSRAISEYCEAAYRLHRDWKRTPAFYRVSKNTPFKGYRSMLINNLECGADDEDVVLLSNIAGQTAVQRRMARMKKRLSKQQFHVGSTADSSGADSKDGIDANIPTAFRGQQFEKWFDMFLMYGKCLAMNDDSGQAFQVLDDVFASNVFCKDLEKRRILKLMILSIAIRVGDAHQINNNIRWWCGSKPCKAVVYKIFTYVMATSASAAAALRTANMYKFMRRQLEQLDPLYYKKRAQNALPSFDKQPLFYEQKDTGQELVSSSRRDARMTICDVAALHTLAGHIMLDSRSNTTPIMQYTLAYTLMPTSPSTALHLGVAYLIFSTKNEVEDKHKAVLQGMAYMQSW
ncbi:transcription factor TFIIIC subunit tfc4 [Dipsacomyces acuminosporus]|nr:transcription factor TFIIIC subunit tfc4 [Dipsacomyces acuminosporus]